MGEDLDGVDILHLLQRVGDGGNTVLFAVDNQRLHIAWQLRG